MSKNSPLVFAGVAFAILGVFWVIACFIIKEAFGYIFLGIGIALLIGSLPCFYLGLKANKAYKIEKEKLEAIKKEALKKEILEEIKAARNQAKKS